MSLDVLLIPFALGLVIPLLTRWVNKFDLPEELETFLNLALSAAAAAVPTLTFNGDWKEYLTAFVVAWLGTMRLHYTNLPDKVWANQVTPGKHHIDADPDSSL